MKSTEVTLVWIPGHQGIVDNEEADRVDSEGSSTVPLGRTAVTATKVGKKTLGTRSSDQVGSLHWLPPVENTAEIPSAW